MSLGAFAVTVVSSMALGAALVILWYLSSITGLRRQRRELIQSQNNFIVSYEDFNKQVSAHILDVKNQGDKWKEITAATEGLVASREALAKDMREFLAQKDAVQRLYEIAKAARDHARGDADGARLAELLDATNDPNLTFTG